MAADFYVVVEISLIKMKPVFNTADNYNLKLFNNELINQTQIWQLFISLFNKRNTYGQLPLAKYFK